MISLINEGLYSAIGKTLNEGLGADRIAASKDEFLNKTNADVNHNLRMYYTHLQISQAHDVLAKHGGADTADHHKAKADEHLQKSSGFHMEARAQHQNMCAIHGDEAFATETQRFSVAKNLAREHVGYKE